MNLHVVRLCVMSILSNSCAALNPANQSWGSVLQSFVTSKNVMDHIVFKNSPFKTSCAAVEFEKRQDLRVLASFQGNRSAKDLKIPCFTSADHKSVFLSCFSYNYHTECAELSQKSMPITLWLVDFTTRLMDFIHCFPIGQVTSLDFFVFEAFGLCTNYGKSIFFAPCGLYQSLLQLIEMLFSILYT